LTLQQYTMKYRYLIIFFFLFPALRSPGQQQQQISQQRIPPVLTSLMANPDATKWTLKDSLLLQFNTHHTQGLLKIGNYFYLSAVEVRTWPHSYGKLINGYDRDTGDGSGYLFKFDHTGRLIAQLQLGEGDSYHPGGIDFDGKHIWVPVCEYRPYGKSILYKVDPESMTATPVASCNDAIGAVAYNSEKKELIGMNWDAEHFYKWKKGKTDILQFISRQKNDHHFIRYQDCQYIGKDIMLCSGLRSYQSGSSRFRVGGLQAIRLSDYSAVWEIPVPIWVGNNIPLNNNPFFAEATESRTTLYFVPEDDRSVMYVYELK